MKIFCAAAARIAVLILTVHFLIPQNTRAQTSELLVLSSNGMKEVMLEVLPECERLIGSPIKIQFDTSFVLKKKIETGEKFDVAILTSDLIDDLANKGKFQAGTRSNIGRTQIGIGIRAGAPKPDISTAEALKAVLLRAKSVTYNRDGASKGYIDKMYDRLGIAREMNPKVILQTEAGRAQEIVAKGEAELVITLTTEILPIPGIELLGALPTELQNYVAFSGAIGTASRNIDAAKAVLSFIAGPVAARTFRTKGMEEYR